MADLPPPPLSNDSPPPFVDGLSVPRQSTIATAPFNKPHADIILRTSDKVDFHVWKGILIEASPVLADMLTLGALANCTEPSSADDDSPTSVPVIDVPEHSSVLDPLLRTCYPPPHAVFASLDVLKPVLSVAHKYQMDGVLDVLKEELLKQAPAVPTVRVYPIALRFDMQDAAKIAARHFLDHPWDEYAPELEGFCAGSYHRLLAYRKQCAKAIEDIFIGELSWLPDRGWHFLTCSCAAESVSCTLRDSDVQRVPRVWFWKHYQRMRAVLAERPCRATIEDPTLHYRAIRDASACAYCRLVVQDSLPTFTVCLQDEIDNRLAEVVLPL